MAKKRIMGVFARGERLIQNIHGFSDTVQGAVAGACKDGKDWVESPDHPATRTVPDKHYPDNVTHFVEAIRVR